MPAIALLAAFVLAQLAAPTGGVQGLPAGELEVGLSPGPNDLGAWAKRLATYNELLPDPGLFSLQRILAYEENQQFAYLLGERLEGGIEGDHLRYRRLLFIRPNVFLADDLRCQDRNCDVEVPVGWSRLPITIRHGQFDPPPSLSQAEWLQDTKRSAPSVVVSEAPSPSRLLVLYQLQENGAHDSPAELIVEAVQDRLQVSVRIPGKAYSLDLPRAYLEPGWLSIRRFDGTIQTFRRPFPAGILPHGPSGLRLIERWDSSYRDGIPPWDTGLPEADLVEAIEKGLLRPCRTVELGSGTGTNAIFLAQKGFDVTGIDIAPTALQIAEERAREAGVKVTWLLADILAPPALEPFDLIFDRGTYHNVRYVDPKGFVDSVLSLSRTGSRFLLLSMNRDGPPGVREHHMRTDFSPFFDFEWIRESKIQTGSDAGDTQSSWSVMLRRRESGSTESAAPNH